MVFGNHQGSSLSFRGLGLHSHVLKNELAYKKTCSVISVAPVTRTSTYFKLSTVPLAILPGVLKSEGEPFISARPILDADGVSKADLRLVEELTARAVLFECGVFGVSSSSLESFQQSKKKKFETEQGISFRK
jgi:hypothetical protein